VLVRGSRRDGILSPFAATEYIGNSAWQRERWEDAGMKVVTAFIKHYRLEEVCQALSKLDITGITITEIKGFGRPRGTAFFPGAEPMVNFLPRIRLEVAVADELVEKIVAAIKGAVRTGQIGDGKIFVTPLEHAVDIRNDEADSKTI
jgi:nitrogen regulatory protein P-II 2